MSGSWEKESKIADQIITGLVAVLLGVVFWFVVGCQGSQFAKYVGCYAHTDFRMDYAHQFGDPSDGGISGVLAPEHGKFGESSFRIDRPDQYAEDRIETGFTVRFAPGSCGK